MKFGVKPKYYSGKATKPKTDDDEDDDGDDDDDSNAAKGKSKKARERTTYITDDPVPLGCAKESKRHELLEKLQKRQISGTEYKSQFAKLMEDVKKPGNPQVVLEVPLVHGSFVVMHGDRMQEIYEVSRRTPTSCPKLMRHSM